MDYQSLKNQWFVLTQSKNLSSKPKRFNVLSVGVVAYRHDKRVVIFKDRCPHRNYPLSQSKTNKKGLQCLYHGWQFDKDGFLVELPGLPSGKSLPKCRLEKIKCKEQNGVIWICLKSNKQTQETPLLLSEQKKKGYDSFFLEGQIEAEYISSIENLLDGFHTPFVHFGLVRSKKKNKVKAIVEQKENLVEISYYGEEGQDGLISKFFEKKRSKSVARFTYPGLAQLEYWGEEEAHFILDAFVMPVDEKNLSVTVKVSTLKSRVPKKLKEFVLRLIFKKVFKQDQKALEAQFKNTESFGQETFLLAATDFIRPSLEKIIKAEGEANLPKEKLKIYEFEL